MMQKRGRPQGSASFIICNFGICKDDYIFSGRLEIDYLNKTYKYDFPESDDYETLAGYIIHYHESIPQTGEEIVIGNYLFRIIKASETKLEEVEIKNNQ